MFESGRTVEVHYVWNFSLCVGKYINYLGFQIRFLHLCSNSCCLF